MANSRNDTDGEVEENTSIDRNEHLAAYYII